MVEGAPAEQFNALERWVLGQLAVPSKPESPDGSPASVRVFHAGRNYYLWSVIMWAVKTVASAVPLAFVSIGVAQTAGETPGWVRTTLTMLLLIVWTLFIVASIVTFIARRLNYLLRWYIVTDRSLRIRSGVFAVNELTMTYGNIQEIRVSAGPLQHLLGLADVEVQAAGGGGGEKQQHRNGHTARFEGLSNANAVRDLMVERLRQYRDSGLGEVVTRAAASGGSEIDAARQLLFEAQALRGVLAAGIPNR